MKNAFLVFGALLFAIVSALVSHDFGEDFEYARALTSTTTAIGRRVAARAATSKKTTSTAHSATPSSTSSPSKPISGDGGWAAAVSKAKTFVSGLTIDEKVNLTTGVGYYGRCLGNTGRITRLNFSGFCMHDAPVGVRDTDYVSVFPSGQNIASTFDRGLMFSIAAAIGSEHRGKGVNVALSPTINVYRYPVGGRNWEGGGGDPYLQAVHGVQNVLGIQSVGVIASAKHFIGGEQKLRYANTGKYIPPSANMGDRTYHEIYEYPFAAVVNAGVGSVLVSYNLINNTFACENRRLLNDLLKIGLDFQGFVLSDWAAVHSLAPSVINGMDVNMPGFRTYGDPDPANPAASTSSYWGKNLGDSIRNGSIPQSRLDDMVTRLMAAYYKMGQDQNYPPVNFAWTTNETYIGSQRVNQHVNVQSNHYKLIREIGSASTVLLKNINHALPLNFSEIGNLAILGSDAGPNPDGANGCADRGCDQGTLAVGWGSGTADFPYLITPADAIGGYMRSLQPTATIALITDDFDYNAIDNAARQADTCLVMVNADSGEEYITVDGNIGDRNNLTLWHAGDELILNVAANCPNTIVVIHAVGQVIMEAWYAHPNVTAILWAGLPGQETGNALLDILNGDVNPSGRLPFTIAKQRSDYPADLHYGISDPNITPQVNYTEKLNVDYRHFDAANIQPRYEFGFGLSYTTFSYGNLGINVLLNLGQVAVGSSQPGGNSGLWANATLVSFTVTNTGPVDGNEVAQLYLGFPSTAGEPPRVLRGFDRKLIKKGQTVTFSLMLIVKDVSIWSATLQSWVVPSGTFTINVGQSSRILPLSGSFSV